MGIYFYIGMAWVVFTSALATIAIIYLAIVGLRFVLTNAPKIHLQETTKTVDEIAHDVMVEANGWGRR